MEVVAYSLQLHFTELVDTDTEREDETDGEHAEAEVGREDVRRAEGIAHTVHAVGERIKFGDIFQPLR